MYMYSKLSITTPICSVMRLYRLSNVHVIKLQPFQPFQIFDFAFRICVDRQTLALDAIAVAHSHSTLHALKLTCDQFVPRFEI